MTDNNNRSEEHVTERILDAATNRGREAIRVIEDLLRFICDDRTLTEELKTFRHDFSALSKTFPLEKRLNARATDEDVGTDIRAHDEYKRASILELATANFCRLQESLRSLEEVTKLDRPEMSESFEQLRYRSYTLEKRIGLRLIHTMNPKNEEIQQDKKFELPNEVNRDQNEKNSDERSPLMTNQNKDRKNNEIWTIPNIITMVRILLAIILFVVFPMKMYILSLILFLLAAGTDWLDGWWARRFGPITQLGRILDPFADKMIVCGTFIYLITIPSLQNITCPRFPNMNWGLMPWMVVVIVLRELLITMLRSLIEGSGGDFSAKIVGKWKMVLQCIAISLCFLHLIQTQNTIPSSCLLNFLLVVSLWATLALTIISGVQYIVLASRSTQKDHPNE